MKRAQWNRLADEFESEVCDITREEVAQQVTRFVNAAKLPAKNSVLVDLGCGLGTFVAKFGDRFTRVIAVDHAQRIVARAKQLCACPSPVEWIVHDVAQIGTRIGTCADLTVCLNVITSSDPEKRAALWRSVATVTKRKGFALVVVPSIESDELVRKMGFRAGRAAEFVATADGLVQRDGAVQKHYSREELASTLTSFGFAARRMGRASYAWSVEGLRKPASAGAKLPWDWICLAQRL